MPSLTRTLNVIEAGIAEGLHIGAQVYVSLYGEPVEEIAVGESRPGVPMTSDTLMLWLSCTKPIAAVALAQLWERRLLDLDNRVTTFIPEFGTKGKDAITLRHLLTHTAGLKWVEIGWPGVPWAAIIAAICDTELLPDWIPGQKAGYQPWLTWFILAEVVRRLDGRPYEIYAREEIFEPLGMLGSWIAMPPEQYRAYGDRIGIMHATEKRPPQPHPDAFDTEAACTFPKPGGSGHGPIRELGAFYEMLLHRGERGFARLLTPQSVEALTARHRVGMYDQSFRHVIDWGLGFILNSNLYGAETVPYGYGPHASFRTFGHGGSQSSTAYCDPEAGLVVAAVFNGMPGEVRHQKRLRAFNTAIYEDLGL